VIVEGVSALVTGGASGLGAAAAAALAQRGARVTVADLVPEPEARARGVHDDWQYVQVDVTESDAVRAAVAVAGSKGPLRVLVHCAGSRGPSRVLTPAGEAGDLPTFEAVIRQHVIGTYNALRLSAEAMVHMAHPDEDRGVCVLTGSVAAFEPQIGQIGYAAAKSAVAGMTLAAARELAAERVRVCTIAAGIFETALLADVPPATRQALAEQTPHPRRAGQPAEFGQLAVQIAENPMLNGATIRLDGALRMPAAC
jgi:NAD(P)-dependent dehydrogenase (short-subunit alcohol dehydrogenase family)